MDKTEVLVVGQGLAGTWLSWWLFKSGITFKIIDHPNQGGASVRAAGLINPVTGRRLVTTWMIDDLLPFAFHAYQDIGDFLGESFMEDTSVIDFFPSVQMLQSFEKRFEDDPVYLQRGGDREKYGEYFQYELGWGAIKSCLLIHVEKLLSTWRTWLKKNNCLLEDLFDVSKFVESGNRIGFENIKADHIIFCDGKSSAENPYFKKLPFALNKGEGLLVEINGLPEHLVFKKGMSLVPYRDNIFWLGSSYEWSFADDQPSDKFIKDAETWLRGFLKLPYKIIEHFAALRPATLERRPFVGFHPMNKQIGILNGFGTKGCSLAPYFSNELVKSLRGVGNIHPLADISRFEKILRRPA